MRQSDPVSYTHLDVYKRQVIGFVGGVDSPVINDFLYGYILGAQSVNPDIKVDTRYIGNYIDPAKGKELAESMINDNNCDIIWGCLLYTSCFVDGSFIQFI